jgi:hypothetical protein
MLRLKPLRARRTVATLAALVCAVAALVSAVACSFIVSNDLSSVSCLPDHADACPNPQVCAPVGNAYKCMPPCAALGCPGGYRCDTTSLWCVSVNDGAISETGTGGDGTTEDASTDVSADANGGSSSDSRADATATDGAGDADAGLGDADACASGGIGCVCSSLGTTTECESTAFCVDWQAVTGALLSDAGAGDGGSRRFCTKACCTSSDCDKGSVCFATGAGGNYCVPASTLGDRSIAGALGGAGGQTCDAGASCRSGLCSSAPGFCVDTCCTTAPPRMMLNSQCSFGASCRVGAFQGSGNDTNFVPRCAPSMGRGRNGDMCTSNSDCGSNLCVNDPTLGLTCRDPCRRPEDCSGMGMFQSQECQYLQLNGTGATPIADLVAVCVPLPPSGQGDGGVVDWGVCRTSGDCVRGYCAPSGAGPSVCVAVCFADTDCISNEKCQPQTLQVAGTVYSVLACK